MKRSSPSTWLRGARRKFARMPHLGMKLGMTRVPDAPALPVRDPWPGDPVRGPAIRCAGRGC